MTAYTHPQVAMLGAAVPLIIADLAASGGPTDGDLETARALVPDLAYHGDTLLYGGKGADAGDLANRLAHAVAVLAFCPGGVTLFGQHWEGRAARRSVGAYYTPSAVLAIIEPQAGSGTWLAELASNPPFEVTP